MKNALLFLLIGAIIGALSYHVYLRRDPLPAAPTPTASVVERTREAATEAKDAIAAKLVEWKLTPADIRQDLAQAGKVVRTKAKAAGENLSDARIIAIIKGKYAIESDLSALAINVDCANGRVVLHGQVDSIELVGKAIRLALDTEGVKEVESQLTAPGAV